ncbi:PRC-barrel domain-containing protein [Patescibacteria group bacterium]|nr:PRC-barrel domain-containing protein [Patescibacteria group bacterium]MBU4482131.1 PRC-barrel domain-containing protein [Patescibacteria group bacterium]
MKISNKKIINLEIETQSGQKLGKIESFNIDIDSQSILEYKIKPLNLIKGLIENELIIPRGQVIEITDEKMIVEDLSVAKKSDKKEKSKARVAQGVAMKENK